MNASRRVIVLKVYVDAESPNYWIIEPKDNVGKEILQLLAEKESEGAYTIRRRTPNETYTLELRGNVLLWCHVCSAFRKPEIRLVKGEGRVYTLNCPECATVIATIKVRD